MRHPKTPPRGSRTGTETLLTFFASQEVAFWVCVCFLKVSQKTDLPSPTLLTQHCKMIWVIDGEKKIPPVTKGTKTLTKGLTLQILCSQKQIKSAKFWKLEKIRPKWT